MPACAKACPTESILFADLDAIRSRAAARVAQLAARGVADAVLCDARDTSVGGTHALFIVRGDPAAYNLPPAPEVPTVYLAPAWRSAAIGAGALLASIIVAFASRRGSGR